ncbi:LysR substrate-binding domain-containing protein [Chenggangzhangella methanolivorans]|uniref:LysR family transcriptional regulator n=1 Tax=Chenggangzhangella methanolivorans TaxID=1437009 RepID=A0A9E6UNN7_9HYPH|nr:LysR substrate-binding domain-containing protein [Chenggangzhangella methanolivorans]QZN98759.1 LysR family transcriptional regulator [Chenggangzhangella methanolivorans]
MSALFDVDQLKTFIAIVDTGSFTRAADAVHKTQSAVSMQMKRLEERVGRSIFARDGRGARLTEDGERLLDYARRIVHISREAVSAFSNDALTGRVRLGVPDDYAERYLPEILARFSRSNPLVEVTVECEPSDTLTQSIMRDEIDLAIITHASRKPVGEVIRQEPLLWVTSQRSLAHEQATLPLALSHPACVWREAAISKLEELKRPHRVLYSSRNFAAVGAAVMAGLAVTVLPESAIRSGMRVLGPADGFPPLPSCKIALLRNPGSVTDTVEALADHIVASLDNMTGGFEGAQAAE